MSDPQPDPAPPTADGRGGPTPEEIEAAPRVQRHRHPRYGAFIATGVVLGIAVAVVLGLVVDPPADYSRGALVGYLAALLAVLGGLAGGAAAVVASRRT